MALKSGDVFRNYPYLWLRQQQNGETEGRKPRPVCVAIATRDKVGRNHLALLPLSTQSPTAGQVALKLPVTVRKAAKLDGSKDVWVFLDEYNYDIEETSLVLPRQNLNVSRLPPRFLKKLVAEFSSQLGAGTKRVTRI